MTALTAAILAGGQSSRMGTNKAFVSLKGRPLIEHVLDRLAQVPAIAETILIANTPADYAHLELPTFVDRIPDKASLGGIYTALHHSQHPYTLVVACDMPLLNPRLLAHMAALCASEQQPYDVIVPRQDGYPQALHAIYGKTCLPPIRADIEADRLKVIGFYDAVRVRYLDEPEYAELDPHGWSFINVNTPDDLARVRGLVSYS